MIWWRDTWPLCQTLWSILGRSTLSYHTHNWYCLFTNCSIMPRKESPPPKNQATLSYKRYTWQAWWDGPITKKRHSSLHLTKRKILTRLIDLTVYLARQRLAFWGDDESSLSNNRGNFHELVHLFSPILLFQGFFPRTNKTSPPSKVTAVMNSRWFLHKGVMLD